MADATNERTTIRLIMHDARRHRSRRGGADASRSLGWGVFFRWHVPSHASLNFRVWTVDCAGDSKAHNNNLPFRAQLGKMGRWEKGPVDRRSGFQGIRDYVQHSAVVLVATFP